MELRDFVDTIVNYTLFCRSKLDCCGFFEIFFTCAQMLRLHLLSIFSLCDIISVKEWPDLENGVRVRSRSFKMARFDRSLRFSICPPL